MYNLKVLYPGSFRERTILDAPKKKDGAVESYNLKICVEEMQSSYEGLVAEKEAVDEACEIAYEKLSKTLKVGDQDPPSLQNLKKIAKAKAESKLGKLSDDTDALITAIERVRESERVSQTLPGFGNG